MSVVCIKRLNSVECTQLIACTPLTNNSAITVKLVCVHSDDPDYCCKSDDVLSQVLNRLKKYFPFVCVQSCSYRYNVVYRITFVTPSPFTFVNILNTIKKDIVTSLQFYFD